jgi:tetratricopeptide (TPR) repeat protein
MLEVNDEEAMCHYEGGLNAIYAGEYDLVVESFKRVIAASPEYAAAHAGLCLAYHESGLSLEMCDAFERLSAIEAANVERLFGIALVYYEGGEISAAHRNAWRAIKLTPNDALTFYVHGRLLLELGRCERGAHFLERALELAPDFRAVHTLLSWISSYLSLGEDKRRLRVIQGKRRLHEVPFDLDQLEMPQRIKTRISQPEVEVKQVDKS